MGPMLTCGLVRSNFAFATGVLLKDFLGSYARARCADAIFSTSGSYGRWPADRMQHTARRGRRGSLPGGLGDDLLGDALRDLAVGVELHAVVRPALGLRPQVADVAEHLRQRHQRTHD